MTSSAAAGCSSSAPSASPSSSLLCGLAVSPEMLVASRALQGLFAAVMLPQGLGMLREMFPPSEMGKAFGMFGPVMGLASVGGPILAGFLIDADFFGTGWRMIFLINLPVGLLAVRGRPALPARVEVAQPALARPARRRAGLDRRAARGLPAGPGPRARLARVGVRA